MNELKALEIGKQNKVNKQLMDEISQYINEILDNDLPRIPFNGYSSFRDKGSRQESEKAYFNVRKQLTALGVYLQYVKPSDKEKDYFNELLWSVANEFTWCLAAHIPYNEKGFVNESSDIIDLFSAETAQTLSELIIIHKDIIDPFIAAFIKRQIEKRIFSPFLNNSWAWEKSKSNWCAVCSGCIGISALLLGDEDTKRKILTRVDISLNNYLNGFGEDGACEEGVGYWAYGFGYYIYYVAVREAIDKEFYLADETVNKIKKIAEFPYFVQISKEYLPFSDASHSVEIPTGLLSYLKKRFNVKTPKCSRITPFDFEHCYRYAHISRNLMWSDEELFNSELGEINHYFADKQWLIKRKDKFYIAVKGGSNNEEHNHNDVGSFVLGIDGETILTDLGAGQYSADYFTDKRYEFVHTRSYWHNLPIIQGQEQIATANRCEIKEIQEDYNYISMGLKSLYETKELEDFKRNILVDFSTRIISISDSFIGNEELHVEEGFVSYIKPDILNKGIVKWQGKSGIVTMNYDSEKCGVKIIECDTINHMGMEEKIYRLGLYLLKKEKNIKLKMKFSLYVGNDEENPNA